MPRINYSSTFCDVNDSRPGCGSATCVGGASVEMLRILSSLPDWDMQLYQPTDGLERCPEIDDEVICHTPFCFHRRMRGRGQITTQTTGQWCRLRSRRACQSSAQMLQGAMSALQVGAIFLSKPHSEDLVSLKRLGQSKHTSRHASGSSSIATRLLPG